MGYQIDTYLAAAGQIRHAVHRQAHTIDRDGAFVGKVLGQTRGRHHPQLPAFTYLGKVADAADAIHMTGHDVPAQAIVGPQRFLEVNGAKSVQAGCFIEGLRRNVDREFLRGHIKGGDRHASAIERNAVAQAHIVQIARRGLNGEALAVG